MKEQLQIQFGSSSKKRSHLSKILRSILGFSVRSLMLSQQDAKPSRFYLENTIVDENDRPCLQSNSCQTDSLRLRLRSKIVHFLNQVNKFTDNLVVAKISYQGTHLNGV